MPVNADHRGRVFYHSMTDSDADLLVEKKLALSKLCRRQGGSVEIRETHMSWLFLGRQRVYKLKKPVRYCFLDFSSVARRRFYCFEEVRLNRRLAASTYLAVLPLCRGADGGLDLAANGEAVDWVVEMMRLPDRDMLDRRMQAAAIQPRDIEAIARLLVRFYVGLPGERIDTDQHLAHIREQMDINAAVLCRDEFGLSEEAWRLVARTRQELNACASEIGRRAAAGFLREGHGDLRPEHVYLTKPLQIIDCLEFNRTMRIVDPYEEVAQLGMECDVAGYEWIGDRLHSELEAGLGGRPSTRLQQFYAASKALLRARLCMAHLLDPDPRKPWKWRPLALNYLRVAAQALQALPDRSGQ